MKYKRNSGIILHPTSLPGPDGIGDLGPEAYRWIDFLASSGCSIWQVLPLGPTGYGDSPYQCFSAFAGNPYLISPAQLLEEDLLTRSDLSDRPSFPEDKVHYGEVIEWKTNLLDRAFNNFLKLPENELKDHFQQFLQEESDWLDNFTLFIAIKESQGGKAWYEWPRPLRENQDKAIEQFKLEYQQTITRHAFRQFLFFRQWNAIRSYANNKNISIFGDIPIFIASDSADTWGNPELFITDDAGFPSVVAGVPPDYFSQTGQLWGNPLYDWEYHKKTNYQWWIKRIKANLKIFDIIRLDHFRGFAKYWEIPAGKPTAEIGTWKDGPGIHFFETLQQELQDLPIVAEDLGFITADVIQLRDHFNFPGMKILQFAFANNAQDPFLPHNYPTNCVAYTGTHDNDTTYGWFASAPENQKDFCLRYLNADGNDIAWKMVRAIWGSVADYAIAPMQDFLRLGTEARMNFPSTLGNNWTWRLPNNSLSQELENQIRELNYLYNRPDPGHERIFPKYE